MNVMEKLIKKYFDKNSSPEEKKNAFESLMNSQPEFMQYFAEEEWDAYMESDEKAGEEGVETVKHKRVVYYKRMAYAAACVSFLFLSFWMSKLYFPNKRSQIVGQKLTESPALMVRINSSGVVEKMVLSDSSVVELYAGSKISYLRNFEPARRSIQLEGAALFKVSKNSQRPFTVFCKEVAATALGTTFKVSNSKSGKVLVELMEGKIVVRRSVTEGDDKKEEYYLLAGNAISFDRPKNMFTKIYSTIAGDAHKAPLTATDKRETKNAESLVEHRIETATGIQFNGEMLPKVLDYMSAAYKVKIIYPTKYIARIRFVGSVHKNENIHTILQNIAMMNDLELKQDTAGNVFIMRVAAK